jgi:hypothetical protein
MKLSYSTKISDVGIIGRLSWLFFVPVIFAWYMFDPFSIISLEFSDKPQFIPVSLLNQNMTKTMLAEFFQTPLSLGWYDVCLDNQNNQIFLNYEKPIDKREYPFGGYPKFQIEASPDLSGISGSVAVGVKPFPDESYDKKYYLLKSNPLEEPKCLPVNASIHGLEIGSTTLYVYGIREINSNAFYQMAKNLNVKIYIKQDWMAFFIKYLIILIIWINLIFLMLKIWPF